MKLSKLAQTYDRVSQSQGEFGKAPLLTRLFRQSDEKTLEAIAHFTVGEVVAPTLSERLGIGPGAIRNAIAWLSGRDVQEVDDAVKELGDMGEVAARLVRGTDRIEVAELWKLTNQTAARDGDRQELIERVFANTTPAGAKYFTRMVLNQMRIGVGTDTLIRSLAEAFDVDADQVQRLYALSNDIGLAATHAQRGGASLRRAGLRLFRPYQFMTAHKQDDPEEVFKRFEGKTVIFEIKYDGARLQIHIKRGSDIRLYSRRLNDDTASMPDLVRALEKAWRGGDAILEGEAVAYDPDLENRLPFQSVLMRLGRKYDIEEKAREIPLVLYLFDLLYDDGENLINVAQKTRRERLKKLFRKSDRVKLSESIETPSLDRERAFFTEAIEAGHEGLMAKDPDAVYEAGKRSDSWMKLKPAFETLDVVIVGGIWGSGRRRGLLSSLILAVRDKDTFKTVGKVGTGFSEETLKDLTARLEPTIITTRGHFVEMEPAFVIEVDFQGIQKTTAYTSGFALR
ncbi:MAG TPA: ATP-dependent DNA ligase, partial [Blastocatellia bacterium]|nr:ATP-dependent DNA ligase [Blastocatellia bacterium]